MTLTVRPAAPAMLPGILDALASWRHDALPVQLHPGDLGWEARFGVVTLAEELRVWQRDSQPLAIGMVDDDDNLVRMAIAPDISDDEHVAAQLADSLCDPSAGVLAQGSKAVEVRFGRVLRERLSAMG